MGARIQVLDKDICILLHANDFGKGMNSSLLPTKESGRLNLEEKLLYNK